MILLAQLVHETGCLTSWWSQRPRRNPAGIGVTGQKRPEQPATGAWQFDENEQIWREGVAFPTWKDDAIPAHIGRMLAYALRDDQANAAQRELIGARAELSPAAGLVSRCGANAARPGRALGRPRHRVPQQAGADRQRDAGGVNGRGRENGTG